MCLLSYSVFQTAVHCSVAVAVTQGVYLAGDRSHGDRQLLVAADGAGVQAHRAVMVDLPLGEARQGLFQRDASLEPGEGRAQAEVGAAAEGDVAVEAAGAPAYQAACGSCLVSGSARLACITCQPA